MTTQAHRSRPPYSDITSAAASRSPMLSQLSALPPICHAEALARVRIAGKALRPANAPAAGKASVGKNAQGWRKESFVAQSTKQGPQGGAISP